MHTQAVTHLGPTDWVMLAQQTVLASERAVMIMVTQVQGSTPREHGSWMLVSDIAISGSLGGGELERMASEAAQAMLTDSGQWQRSRLHCVLGPDLGQCCGGTIELLLEPIDSCAAPWLSRAAKAIEKQQNCAVSFNTDEPHDVPQLIGLESRPETNAVNTHLQVLRDHRPHLFVFGAGHVGRAVCAIAAELPLRITVVDSRNEWLSQLPTVANITPRRAPVPELVVGDMPSKAAALVMTYSHDLDYRLCRRLLARDGLLFIGLIGSRSKATRFRRRLKGDGISDLGLQRLVSPIGQNGPPGKEPGIIALAALAEVLCAMSRQQSVTKLESHVA